MKNILVVDDSQDVADLVKFILELSDHKVTAVNSGREGLSLISNQKFDLILLDVAMPDVTGLDVLKKVKSDPKTASNKIVFITASSPSEETVESLIEHGALEILKKPLNEEKLLEIVAKYA